MAHVVVVDPSPVVKIYGKCPRWCLGSWWLARDVSRSWSSGSMTEEEIVGVVASLLIHCRHRHRRSQLLWTCSTRSSRQRSWLNLTWGCRANRIDWFEGRERNLTNRPRRGCCSGRLGEKQSFGGIAFCCDRIHRGRLEEILHPCIHIRYPFQKKLAIQQLLEAGVMAGQQLLLLCRRWADLLARTWLLPLFPSGTQCFGLNSSHWLLWGCWSQQQEASAAAERVLPPTWSWLDCLSAKVDPPEISTELANLYFINAFYVMENTLNIDYLLH